MNPRYCGQLQQVLTWRGSLGIVGGRPSSSLYFVGAQAERVLYLDPHDVQDVRARVFFSFLQLLAAGLIVYSCSSSPSF